MLHKLTEMGLGEDANYRYLCFVLLLMSLTTIFFHFHFVMRPGVQVMFSHLYYVFHQ